jgi:hypothetical protein
MPPCPQCQTEIQYSLAKRLFRSSPVITCPNCSATLRATIQSRGARLLLTFLILAETLLALSITITTVFVNYPFIAKWSLACISLALVLTIFLVPIALIGQRWTVYRSR